MLLFIPGSVYEKNTLGRIKGAGHVFLKNASQITYSISFCTLKSARNSYKGPAPLIPEFSH
jgi:hypothetical protein